MDTQVVFRIRAIVGQRGDALGMCLDRRSLMLVEDIQPTGDGSSLP